MWLLVIIISLFIIFLTLYLINEKIDKSYKLGDFFSLACFVTGFILCIMLLVLSITKLGSKIDTEKANVVYDSLIYQIENDIYDDLDGEGKKQLYKEVQDWNSDLAIIKKVRENKWISIFVSEKVDSLKYIPIESIDNK